MPRALRTAYSLFGSAVTPLLPLWLARRARRGKEDPFRINERFGHATIARPEGALLWLHAASVGEVQSVLTLLRALLAQHPALHVLITTGTITSAAHIAGQNLPRVIHQFLPLDTPSAVRRFLQHWRPDLALWVESEFWPQLLWQARACNIPMLLINARISARTYAKWKRWPRTISGLLQGFTAIYAGSTEDAARLQALGANNIQDAGNLKYDADPLPADTRLMEQLAAAIGMRPVFLAASTHANEEVAVTEAHKIVAQQFPDLLTIIVPRHAARGATIATSLRAKSFNLAQRSKSEPITTTTEIYLADTMGELGSFYRLAQVVFMGGSLIPHGGQNPLEAARLSCAIITGPYTHNFAAIIESFLARDAIRVVNDSRSLAVEVTALLADEPSRVAMIARAMEVVARARGASTIILHHCSELLGGRA